MGAEATKRFVGAQDLIEEFLDTRIPEELPHDETLVYLTEVIARRALSNEVITPGVTTVGDIRRWLYDALWENGITATRFPQLATRGTEGTHLHEPLFGVEKIGFIHEQAFIS